ncbi:MAG: AI-2E family transporter [Candidatus Levyibacteriota bacterium]
MDREPTGRKKLLLTSETTRSSPAISREQRDLPLAIIGWLAVVIIFFWLLGQISHALLLLVIAAFLAHALFPGVRFLERFMPRFFAILFVYLVVLLGLSALIYFVVSTAIVQLSTLSHHINYVLAPKGQGASPLFLTLERFGISQIQIAQASEQLTTQAEHLTGSIVPFLRGIFSFILDILLIAILSIYLLIDGTRMTSWLKNNTPLTQQRRVNFLLLTLERIVGGYIRGQVLLAAIIGFLIGIGMALFHVPYAILIGVLAFILAFIPILGTFISGAICVLLALTQGWFIALLVLGYFIIMHIVEGDILGPRIVGKALGLHPLVSIIALIVGSELFGIVGALFASPVAGVVQAVLVTLWSEWRATHPETFAQGKEKISEEIEKNLANKPVGPRKKLHLLRK